MKVVKRTTDYTVYQKRSERYAVQSANKAWINGDEKITILLAEGLIKTTLPKPPEPEPAAEEVAEEATESATEAAADDGAAEEAAPEKAPAEDAAAEDAPEGE